MNAAPQQKEQQETDWFSPRRVSGMAAGFIRRSAVVEKLRRILPLGAAALLAIIFIVPNVNTPTMKPKNAASIDATMRDAHFESRDGQGRPYAVEAPVARQEPDAPGVTDLATPKARLDLGNGGFIDAAAGKAKYDDKTGTLEVKETLTLKKDDGTTFTTDAARIDVNTQNAEGSAPVVLEGDFGRVTGEGFKAIDGGKTIIFTGESRATIKLGNSPPKPAAPTQTPPRAP